MFSHSCGPTLDVRQLLLKVEGRLGGLNIGGRSLLNSSRLDHPVALANTGESLGNGLCLLDLGGCRSVLIDLPRRLEERLLGGSCRSLDETLPAEGSVSGYLSRISVSSSTSRADH